MTTTADCYKVHPKIVSEIIDGEVIILNLDRGRYYSLTLAGTDAWSALGQAATAEEIVDHLLARYDAPRGEVEGAVRQLLSDLQREELIQPVPVAGAVTRAPRNGSADGPAVRPAFQAPVLQAYTDMEDLLLLDPIHEVDESGWPNRP